MTSVTMREYVDGLRGPGAWDRMHDAIGAGQMFGWDMPPVRVDDAVVHIFPGTNREVLLEDVKSEIRRTLRSIDSNDAATIAGSRPMKVQFDD